MARSLLLVVSAVVATSVSTTHAAFTVSEASGSGYEPCSTDELTPFAAKITAESNACAAISSYDWNSQFLPTADQREELCGCKSLISKLQTLKVPHCGFFRTSYETFASGFYSYKQIVEFVFGDCGSSSTSASTTTTARATSTPTTYTPFTYSPIATYTPSFDLDTSHSSSSKSKSKTGVVVGVVVALLVVAAAIGGFVWKRKKNASLAGKADDQASSRKSSLSDMDVEAGIAQLDVGDAHAELSPLGGGDAASHDAYEAMPPSPSAPPTKES